MDLRRFNETELDVIKRFTESLAEQNQQIDFDDVDLDGAERQSKDFIERRKAGYRNSEIKSDADIRTEVRDYLRRRGVYRNDNPEKDTQFLSITKPNY